MSYSTVLGVVPNRRPVDLAELSNAHGWAASIWSRLLRAHGYDENYWRYSDGDFGDLGKLWRGIDTLPEWQQIPLVLTFDTGVIPLQAFTRAAGMLDEFDKQLPAPEGHVNHVSTVAELLRSGLEAPFVGVYGTSVSDNPFDPHIYEEDADGNVLVDEHPGIPLSKMYVLERHRQYLPGGGAGDRGE